MNEFDNNTPVIDLDYLEKWTCKEPVRLTETLELRPAQGLAAMLDQPYTPEKGDVLPPLWQWVYFTPTPLASELGADGHPVRGGFLPPVPLLRRMWAASRIKIETPLRFDETVEKQSRVADVKLKQGSNGPLVFVNVEHRYHVADQLRINELQTLVYVGIDKGGKPRAKTELFTESCDWSAKIQPDSVLLFRYSALTSNAHRIHYDRDYAVNQEGHPGLLVHAPLTATLLAGSTQERPGRPPGTHQGDADAPSAIH